LVAAGQAIVGLGGFVAVFMGVSWSLSDGRKLEGAEIIFASAEHWPEIKAGVPALKTSNSVVDAPTGLSSTSDVSIPRPRTLAAGGTISPSAGSATTNLVPPSVAALAADSALQPLAVSPPYQPPLALPAPTSDAPVLEGAFRADAAIGSSEQITGALRPGSSEEPTGDGTGSRNPGAASIKPLSSTPTTLSPTQDNPGHTAKEIVQSGAVELARDRRKGPQGSEGTRKARAEINRAKVKSAQVKNARTAAAQQKERLGNAATSAPAAPALDERTRVFGIPIPTGREVQRCLLEFQC
jgi:hypothetical protein